MSLRTQSACDIVSFHFVGVPFQTLDSAARNLLSLAPHFVGDFDRPIKTPPYEVGIESQILCFSTLLCRLLPLVLSMPRAVGSLNGRTNTVYKFRLNLLSLKMLTSMEHDLKYLAPPAMTQKALRLRCYLALPNTLLRHLHQLYESLNATL